MIKYFESKIIFNKIIKFVEIHFNNFINYFKFLKIIFPKIKIKFYFFNFLNFRKIIFLFYFYNFIFMIKIIFYENYII